MSWELFFPLPGGVAHVPDAVLFAGIHLHFVGACSPGVSGEKGHEVCILEVLKMYFIDPWLGWVRVLGKRAFFP
jgi:hypothetical protein